MFQPFAKQDTIRLTLSQAIIKFLQTQYTDYDGVERRFIQGIWGIFGHGNVSGLSQAIVEHGDNLPYYQPFNEQSQVHAAAGFARANNRMATMTCTTSIGPGATNMITGASTATINRIPVLLLPSDYYATRFQGQVLQDIEHPVSMDMSVTDCFRVVSRFYDRVTRPEQILFSLPEAMRVMTDPVECGVATIALPQDIQSVAYDYPANFFNKKVWRVERRKPDEKRLEEALQLLQSAKRPYIVAGGGVHFSEAWEALAQFAEQFGIPVGETYAGRGAIRNGSRMLVGGTGHSGTPVGGKFAQEADLVFLVGTRLSDFTTGSNSLWQNPDVKFVSINVSSMHAHKLGALPIVADAKTTLEALTSLGQTMGIKPHSAYIEEIDVENQGWWEQLQSEVFTQIEGEIMSQGQLIGVLNEETHPNDTVVSAAGTGVGDLMKIWNASNRRNIHLEFGNSCMGYDIPAAIGVRMAQSEGEVYVLIGDGGFMMAPSEIATATQENAKITVILSENYGYQSIHGHQFALVGHSLGNEFKIRDQQSGKLDDGEFIKIDYAKMAEGMGARAWTATTPDEFREALREARNETRSCMIVVPTEKYRRLPDSGIWWDVFGAEVTDDPKTKDLVDQREAGRKDQRFYW